ncbi:MAG: hypothetical protein JNL58_04530 [Planctomyces sp.]|nr:hypothetical protein [Planctomyces sp.]
MPINLPTASNILTLVYTKATWAGSWVERSLMECLSIQDNAAPSHSSAVFRYRYGGLLMPAIGSRPEDTSAATEARPSLLGHYVKVVITGVAEWYGVIPESADNRRGLLATVPTGEVTYNAFGLTWLLDQAKPVRQSKVKTGTGTTVMINRGIPFNGGTGSEKKSSRSRWKNYDATEKSFTDRGKTTSPAAWKASNAIEYLLDNFAPKDSSGAELLPFVLDSGALSFLDYEIPFTEYHGRTVWQIINQLVARYRGLGFHAWVDTAPTTPEVKLKVWSQNAAAITLPSGGTIPLNPDTATYDFDTAKNVLDATISTTLLTQFDQIVVEGERAGSIFTVRPTEHMYGAWPSVEEDDYESAATGQTSFSSMTDEDKLAANTDWRARDYLAKVFSQWKLDSTWTGRADTDPSSASHDFAFPELDEDGADNPATSAKFQRAGLRFQSYIPLLPGIDYTTGVDSDTNGDDEQEADFLPPIVLFKTQAINTAHTADVGWVHAERINEAVASGSEKRLYPFSVDVQVRDDAPGLILRVVGAPQHYICQDQFDSNGAYEDIPADQGLNMEDWLATVYVLQDDFCRAVYPLQADLPTLDLVRQLLIKYPGAHLDYLVDGTIVGVEGGGLVKNSDGGVWLRDDRERCKDIARLAFAWYGAERRTLSLGIRGIVAIPDFALGVLVTDIGSGATLQTINTVITSVAYDLVAGTTRISTQFGEIDFISSFVDQT